MNQPYAGGCACGAVRYRIDDEPLAMNDCQCRQCQHRSGTGHGSYLTFATREHVEVGGETTVWKATADNGNVKYHAFCPTCGTPVFLTFSDMPAAFTIHAGSLDDPSRYRPQVTTFASRAQAWDRVDAALPSFQRMPQGD